MCTPEELCKAFDVPYTPRPVMAGLPQSANMAAMMPNLPGHYSSPATKPTRKGRRRKTPVDPNGPTCIYTFTRGQKKGAVCGEPVSGSGAPGSDEYCTQCLKKKSVQNRIASGASSKSTVKPPVMPGGLVQVEESPVETNENSVNAVPIEGTDDMFKEVNNGYILKRYPDGNIVAIAIEDENGQRRDLTHDEKVAAQVRGISVLDSPQAESVPDIPTVPQSHEIPTIPVVPDINSSAAPVAAGSVAAVATQ
jgi:hypothetical protein